MRTRPLVQNGRMIRKNSTCRMRPRVARARASAAGRPISAQMAVVQKPRLQRAPGDVDEVGALEERQIVLDAELDGAVAERRDLQEAEGEHGQQRQEDRKRQPAIGRQDQRGGGKAGPAGPAPSPAAAATSEDGGPARHSA